MEKEQVPQSPSKVSQQSPLKTSEQKNPLDDQQHKETTKKAEAAMKKRNTKDPGFFSKYQYHIAIGIILAICLYAFCSKMLSEKIDVRGTQVIIPDVISQHNAKYEKKEVTFSLGPNELFKNMTLYDARQLVNVMMSNKKSFPRCPTGEEQGLLPEKYNFYEEYPICKQPVYNQGNCSSSYALIPASVIADRFCQASKGKIKERLGVQQLLYCDKTHSNQCVGGYVSRSLDFAQKRGLALESCVPYKPNNSTRQDCKDYSACPIKYKISSYCITVGEEGLKRELKKNGPVIAVIPTYIDFFVYKDGIYQVMDGVSKFNSGQAIKILGWEKDKDTGLNYWIVENTWGESWGKNGLAYILNKNDMLYIEANTLAPIPEYENPDEKKEEAKTETSSSQDEKQQTEQTPIDEQAEQITN